MARVDVRGELLRWARDRARLGVGALETRFPHLPQWESGEKKPTLKQLETYAKATRTPVGYFFLHEPPEEPLPIPDFRTMGGRPLDRPSPDLIEMVLACQERQEWFRDYAQANGSERLAFVGSATVNSPIVETATAIRNKLGFELDERRRCPTWAEALRTRSGSANLNR